MRPGLGRGLSYYQAGGQGLVVQGFTSLKCRGCERAEHHRFIQGREGANQFVEALYVLITQIEPFTFRLLLGPHAPMMRKFGQKGLLTLLHCFAQSCAVMHTKHIHRGKDLTFTLTFQQTLEAVSGRRPCSGATLRRYIRKLGIRPAGNLRTRPLRFSADTPNRILSALGEKIATMAELRAERARAQKARAA